MTDGRAMRDTASLAQRVSSYSAPMSPPSGMSCFEDDALAEAVQGAAFAAAQAKNQAMTEVVAEVTTVRLEITDLRALLAQESDQRKAGLQRLERGIERLHAEQQAAAGNMSELLERRGGLQTEQDRLARRQAESQDQLQSRQSQLEQRLGELRARCEESLKQQAPIDRFLRDNLSDVTGRLNEVLERVDALQKQVAAKASHQIVEDMRQAHQNNLKELFNQFEQRFEDVNGRGPKFEGSVRDMFTDMRSKVENLTRKSAQMESNIDMWAQKFAQDTRQLQDARFQQVEQRFAEFGSRLEEITSTAGAQAEREARKRAEAERMLGTLVHDIAQVRDFTNSPPMLSTAFSSTNSPCAGISQPERQNVADGLTPRSGSAQIGEVAKVSDYGRDYTSPPLRPSFLPPVPPSSAPGSEQPSAQPATGSRQEFFSLSPPANDAGLLASRSPLDISPGSGYGLPPPPLATRDYKDGKADLYLTGPDENRDGISDVLQKPRQNLFYNPS